MKVLFINPSLKREVAPSVRAQLRYDPPLSSLYLASFLSERGISSDIVDTAIDSIDWEKIRAGEYGLISFTVFIGEFLKKAHDISLMIKGINPAVPIVFGGVMASIFPEEILNGYPVDFVVRYEGEHTLYELVQFLEGKREIGDTRGLSYKVEGKIVHNSPRCLEPDLDSFPVPRWEFLGSHCNIRQVPYYFAIMTSKGCPFKCSFCYNRQVEESILSDSPVWRYRSAAHVISEVESISALTGTRVFTIGDDNFLVNRARAITILDHFRNRRFYIEQCIGHMNNFDNHELMQAMAGVVQTAVYALESASPRLLKLLNKNLDLSKVPSVNKRLFLHGITTIHNFIVGLPTEKESDLKENVRLMMELKKINPYVRGNPYLYLPLPFTPLESYIINEMGFTLSHDLERYEHARFDFEETNTLRPWIDPERYALLKGYCDVFRDAFQINNLTLSDRSLSVLDENPKLKMIFSGIETVNRPSVPYVPYVLDRVLNGEEINLGTDLPDKVR